MTFPDMHPLSFWQLPHPSGAKGLATPPAETAETAGRLWALKWESSPISSAGPPGHFSSRLEPVVTVREVRPFELTLRLRSASIAAQWACQKHHFRSGCGSQALGQGVAMQRLAGACRTLDGPCILEAPEHGSSCRYLHRGRLVPIVCCDSCDVMRYLE